jgi:phage terminase small subunit
LVGYASDEWSRVAPVLWSMGLLSPLDVGPFAGYCWAFGLWRLAVEQQGEASPAERPVLAKIARDACRDAVRYAALFGMMPSARTRVAPSKRPGPSKFADLLA